MADEIKTVKKTLTNKTDGPKIVNSIGGGVTLAPGEEREVEIAETELTSLTKLGFLDPSTADRAQEMPSNPQEDDGVIALLTQEQREEAAKLANGNNSEALHKIAKDEEVQIADGDTKATVAAKIIAKRNA